jgi:hypothetical protein
MPGVYFTSSAATMGGTLTLDGKGSSNSAYYQNKGHLRLK